MPSTLDLPVGFRPTYPVREAFNELRVSPPTGYRLISSGELQTYTVGSRRYVSGAELARFIREREQRGRAA